MQVKKFLPQRITKQFQLLTSTDTQESADVCNELLFPSNSRFVTLVPQSFRPLLIARRTSDYCITIVLYVPYAFSMSVKTRDAVRMSVSA